MINTDNQGDFTHDQCDMICHMPFLEEAASRSGVIVEIGVGHGNGSTRAFSRGLERSSVPFKLHVGVDIDPERPQIKPATDWWRMVHGASEDPLTAFFVGPQIVESDPERRPDIIFIDTVHTYEQMALELPIWSKLAGPNTLWIFHDTNMFQVYNHMSVAIEEFANANDWEFFEYALESHGLGLMRKKGGTWSDIVPREFRATA